MSLAHRDRVIQEWNELRFRSFVKDGKDLSQALEELLLRARDIQVVLKELYNSRILLRDTIVRAVRGEGFTLCFPQQKFPKIPTSCTPALGSASRRLNSEQEGILPTASVLNRI